MRLVLADRVVENGCLRIEGGMIAEIVEQPGAGSGHTIYPGFIDMHGDMIEHELEPRPGVDFPMGVAVAHLDARLAASGVTTAYAGVSFSRTANKGERRSFEHTTGIIQALKTTIQDTRVDHRIHARFDVTYTDAIAALEGLLDAGAVDLVSVMDHTPGQGQYRNVEKFIAYRMRTGSMSEEQARAQVQVRIDTAVPAEQLLRNLQEVSRLCGSRAVAMASHDDDTVEKTNLMADIGAVISEFPVTMEAAKTAVDRGLMIAMGAPNAMRGQSYSGNLSAREAHAAGLLHILAADYHPAAILPAIHALAAQDPDGLVGATRLASANPAKALGLTDRGEIAIGKRADLAIVDAENRVAKVLLRGEVIHSNGTVRHVTAAAEKAA
ncbi:Metal-dependent hydrolase involved in phosphonate metabolism [Candidatus Rhodobacter oscarellae]|uniref:Metal-dependent hydrolase involved in phosphonate metabolism n=1 Tax=Candidatus Rhodobacter oscarellae TaxID=1675527 RepID=A0A0J9E4S5_9RHOB|nr:alpha-D-ribose 1-methylphosphonate 5-triphosphate diphosphatase [Candidatus Rhodobacter lobularis]KMW57751.1 Metal-dependent hydrolase involved in phosphonate metabolism [Candidatus Rhodobacter lobularis]